MKDNNIFSKIKSFIINPVKTLPKDSFSVVRTKNQNKEKYRITPELVQYFDHIDMDKLDSRFKELIMEFYNTLKENFSEEYLINFYNNINTLTIYHDENANKKRRNKRLGGVYTPINNSITIVDINDKFSLFHELLHMSSCIEKDGQIFSGFHQTNNGRGFGIGLNELTTAYILQKYFNEKEETYINSILPTIANFIKYIIGEDIEKFYLKSDLFGLINGFRNYYTEKEIIKFINVVDMVYVDTCFSPTFLVNDVKEMFMFLIKALYIKCANESQNEEECMEKFNSLISNSSFDIAFANCSISAIKNQDIDYCIKEAKRYLNKNSMAH